MTTESFLGVLSGAKSEVRTSEISKILLVEDDESIRMVVRDTLNDAGYVCDVASRGLQGLEHALSGEFDLIILDINLPGLSGLDICREVKRLAAHVPVLLLSARDSESDIVSGFEIGADDYITKPFRPKELLARVRARLRSKTDEAIAVHLNGTLPPAGNQDGKSFSIGEFSFDPLRKRITKNGKQLDLSAMETDFLLLIASQPGRPFTRDELLEQVWRFSAEHYSSNVSIFVCRLRKKLEDDVQNPKYLLTVSGRGYRFAEPDEV